MCDPIAAIGSPAACIAGAVASSGLDYVAQQTCEAAGRMVVWAVGWWTLLPSVDPTSAVPDIDNTTDPIHTLQGYTMPVVGFVLVLSILVQAARMIISRRRDPAVNVAVGLLRYATVCALGLPTVALALKAGDALSRWVIGQAADQFGARMAGLAPQLFQLHAMLALLLGAVLALLALIQWLLVFVRQAGILVLAVMLPLAASGSISDYSKPWLRKLAAWLLALVTYKPMAALIYTIGFTLMGTGQTLSTTMTGLIVIVLAVVALPTMMAFFSFAGADTSGGGVGGVVAVGAVGALGATKLINGLGSGGAVDSAARMDRSGPGSNHPPALPAGSSGGGSGGGGGGGLVPTGATPSAGNPAPTGPAPGAGGGGGGGGGGGPAAGGGMPSGPAGGESAAAAAGPAGAAAAGAAAVARGAYQAGREIGEQMGGQMGGSAPGEDGQR